MNRLPRGATAALLGLSLTLLGTGTAVAAPIHTPTPAPTQNDQVRLELPRPTGQSAVGRDTLHLVDKTRPDPWVPEAGARELMVSLYYPARPGHGRSAPYMTTGEARAFLEDRDLADAVPAETLSGTRTHARPGARPAQGSSRWSCCRPGSASTARP